MHSKKEPFIYISILNCSNLLIIEQEMRRVLTPRSRYNLQISLFTTKLSILPSSFSYVKPKSIHTYYDPFLSNANVLEFLYRRGLDGMRNGTKISLHGCNQIVFTKREIVLCTLVKVETRVGKTKERVREREISFHIDCHHVL